MYLVSKKSNRRVAHLWNGTDTLCRLYSTGGMRQNKFKVSESAGNRDICVMCKNVKNRKTYPLFIQTLRDNMDYINPTIDEPYDSSESQAEAMSTAQIEADQSAPF